MTAPSLNRRLNIRVFEKNTALLPKVRRYFCVYSQQQGFFRVKGTDLWLDPDMFPAQGIDLWEL